jgi:pilus assembly protein Flp/PilA
MELDPMKALIRYMSDESGASAAEYALILALIAAAIIGALTTLGGNIANVTNNIAGTIGSAS